jgi:hypothetical protein
VTAFVGLDVDGVVADFCSYVVHKLDLDPALNTDWDFAKTYGPAVDAQIRDMIHDPATWVSLEPFAYAEEAVATLAAKKINPVFITVIPRQFLELRRWWLRQHFDRALGRYPVWFYVASSFGGKPQLAKGLGLTHFVEDKPSTAAGMARAGLTSILVPTSYMGTPPKGVRVQTLLDFAREVQ